jgi:phosphatidylinositol alpha-1,6-mannosyltransferase
LKVTPVRDRVLVVATDCGVSEDGTYRPGGLQLFSRLVIRALAESGKIQELGVLSLVDSQRAMERTLGGLLAPTKANRLDLRLHGCGGSRVKLGFTYLKQRPRYGKAIFLHINVARLGVLTPLSPLALWLVGIEVRRRLRIHERFVVRKADPLLSISAFSTREMRRFNPDLPDATTVHLSIEPDEAWLLGGGDGRSGPPPYQAAKRSPAVLVVARMSSAERYKGHDHLIDAWPAVVRASADAELWIVGEGDDTPRLRARAGALPESAARQVHFLGRLDHASLLDRYARARAFAMPSIGEGFGLVFVEAMRAGLPCIASFDSSAEIVRDQETGLVVKQDGSALAAACIELLGNDALADRFSASGRARYETQFTYPAFKERFLRAVGAD